MRRPTRTAPVEYRDAVELWARQFGGHADIRWVPHPANVWQVLLQLKPNDPRRAAGEEWETVELHRFIPKPYAPGVTAEEQKKLRRHPRTNAIMPGFIAYELDELGVSGVVEFLSKGSLMSGRGQFTSAEQAGEHVRQQTRDERTKEREGQRERARERALDRRRTHLKIPFLPVGIELRREPKEDR